MRTNVPSFPDTLPASGVADFAPFQAAQGLEATT
jgi:hypothetical protein